MRKFLIVDDNVALAENLAEIIADADMGEVVLADSGVRALGLAAGTQFDALVSDVRMPDMSGLELCLRMRLVDPGLPAVLMTALSAGDESLSARQDGILCILPKPVPIACLLDLLSHATRRDGAVEPVGPHTVPRDSYVEEPGVFTTWSNPERLMNELERLYKRRPMPRSMNAPSRIRGGFPLGIQ